MPIAMSAEEASHYARDGFLLRKGLLSPEEVGRFRDRARSQLEQEQRGGSVMTKADREGKTTLLKMWTKAGDDQYGLLARDERMVDLAQDAIGKPVYLYSHKMTMKQPNEGGAWEWHQDFGYWYNYGCLAPDMMSIYVALDRATRENGCLQVLRGSHKLGRLEHVREDGQTNAERSISTRLSSASSLSAWKWTPATPWRLKGTSCIVRTPIVPAPTAGGTSALTTRWRMRRSRKSANTETMSRCARCRQARSAWRRDEV